MSKFNKECIKNTILTICIILVTVSLLFSCISLLNSFPTYTNHYDVTVTNPETGFEKHITFTSEEWRSKQEFINSANSAGLLVEIRIRREEDKKPDTFLEQNSGHID